MPRIRRWFHVSHDINADPEVWDLTDRFGDRALRIWLEILSIADRNEGRVPQFTPSFRRYLANRSRTSGQTVARAWAFFLERLWIVQPEAPRTRNYRIYHPTREPNSNRKGKSLVSPPYFPSSKEGKKDKGRKEEARKPEPNPGALRYAQGFASRPLTPEAEKPVKPKEPQPEPPEQEAKQPLFMEWKYGPEKSPESPEERNGRLEARKHELARQAALIRKHQEGREQEAKMANGAELGHPPSVPASTPDPANEPTVEPNESVGSDLDEADVMPDLVDLEPPDPEAQPSYEPALLPAGPPPGREPGPLSELWECSPAEFDAAAAYIEERAKAFKFKPETLEKIRAGVEEIRREREERGDFFVHGRGG